ncbi:MAG TPA: DUF6788 family protein [Acidimicrobiales bacterium]|nr:DUF6788 family protein [Acidimicrobiales bacterium]
MAGPRLSPEARAIRAELARIGPVLPGTVTQRYTRCGRAGCRCMADPPQPHGPYWSWTRKVANKTVTRYLSEEEYADYRGWFDNARRLRELLGELEKACLAALESDHRRAGDKPRPKRR